MKKRIYLGKSLWGQGVITVTRSRVVQKHEENSPFVLLLGKCSWSLVLEWMAEEEGLLRRAWSEILRENLNRAGLV